MALSFRKSRTRVPVKNRRSGTKLSAARKVTSLKPRVGTVELIVLAIVSIVLLLAIALPLRNYFEQRNEIKQVSQAIAQKQQRKEELLAELDRFQNKAYLDEQARNRLGVIAPGEVPFRILDPGLTKEDSLTTKNPTESTDSQVWYETLWGSIVTPAAVAPGQEESQPTPEMKLPVEQTEPQP